MEFIEERIKSLSTAGLMAMYEDVIYRIGSHVTGGNPVVEYVRKQEKILDLIQDELVKRREHGAS
jgi:hypothetical protein